MRTILVAALLILGGIAVAPVASAEPCEVPGCTLVGAALCVASHGKDVTGWKMWLDDCLTATA